MPDCFNAVMKDGPFEGSSGASPIAPLIYLKSSALLSTAKNLN
jgi:hypothetical protein